MYLFQAALIPTLNTNGEIAEGSNLYAYLEGTTTPTPTYTSKTGAVQNAHPVVANSVGRFPEVWLNPNIPTRIKVTNSDGSDTLYDVDPIDPALMLGTNVALYSVLAGDGGAGLIGTTSGETVQSALNALVVGLFVDIDTLTIPSDANVIRTSGYSTHGLGRAHYNRDNTVDAATVTAHPRSTVISADGQGWRLSEPVWDFEMFGAIPDNATDCYSAWTAMKAYGIAMRRTPGLFAFDYVSYAPAPVRMCGEYYSSQTWQVHLSWAFFSGIPAGISGGNQRARLRFPANTMGIVLNNERSNGDQIGAESSQYSAAGTSFSGISIVGGGGTDQTKHGLWARTRHVLIDCAIANFSGNLYQIIANSGATTLGTNTVYGNANDTFVRGLTLNNYRVGLHAMYVKGEDANACTFIGIDVLFADHSGIFDYSFLGNSYFAPKVHDCGYAQKGVVSHGGRAYALIWEEPGMGSTITPGTDNTVWYDIGVAASQPAWSALGTYVPSLAIFLANPNNRSQVVNPYVEGALVCHADSPAVVTSPNGGTWTRYSPIIYSHNGLGGQMLSNVGMGFIRGLVNDLSGHSLGTYFAATTGYQINGGQAAMLTGESQLGSTFRFVYTLESATINWDFDNTFEITRWHSPDTTFTGGRSAAIPGAFQMKEFFLGAGNDARSWTMAVAAPTTGYHAQGEYVKNRTPTVGQPKGWVCTVSGTPGTWVSEGNL